MAKNFRILSEKKNGRSFRIKLQGDFDGTSAHELVNLLHAHSAGYPEVAIDTEGLNSVHCYGLNVFIIRMKLMRKSYAGIVFSGKFKFSFVQE